MVQTTQPVGDKTWTEEDKASARTIEARWSSMGLSQKEIQELLPCWVWKKKLPGLQYTDGIETRLSTHSIKS